MYFTVCSKTSHVIFMSSWPVWSYVKPLYVYVVLISYLEKSPGNQLPVSLNFFFPVWYLIYIDPMPPGTSCQASDFLPGMNEYVYAPTITYMHSYIYVCLKVWSKTWEKDYALESAAHMFSFKGTRGDKN